MNNTKGEREGERQRYISRTGADCLYFKITTLALIIIKLQQANHLIGKYLRIARSPTQQQQQHKHTHTDRSKLPLKVHVCVDCLLFGHQLLAVHGLLITVITAVAVVVGLGRCRSFVAAARTGDRQPIYALSRIPVTARFTGEEWFQQHPAALAGAAGAVNDHPDEDTNGETDRERQGTHNN